VLPPSVSVDPKTTSVPETCSYT